ncbi:hypothetical protein ASD11_14640 [Aeromicrobium sp. Root495]|uniref:hypothetical protein n=1 Tax=Aeromicrobium sp. Root495 TaxID=1736550 RepID=UPI0006FE2DD0|nr:hypothetical protein [Aeromicrobium sp. Root495]KQY55747.1 hypothetical protein ASD11_14640 [Aeromicrobium sp. Root495]
MLILMTTSSWWTSQVRRHVRQRVRTELGASTIEVVLIAAGLAAIALAALAILKAKVLDTANSVPTN